MADVPNLDNDAADGTAEFAQALEHMAAQERLAAEAAERRKRSARELRDLYGDFASTVDKAAKRNADLMRSMGDGTFARQARDMAELNRQYERFRREAELGARFGAGPGGWLARNERALGALGRVGSFAAGATLASGAGLVRQGFSGTVEEARLSRETKMLGRELAGAFVPVIDTTTRLTRSLRQFLESLGPTGQNAVMAGGVALSGLATARFLGLGGAAAALIGGGGSAAVMGATAAGGGAAAGAAGGALAGAGRAGAGRVSAGTAARSLGARALGALGRATAIGVPIYSAYEGATGGYYGELRARGHNKLAAGVGAVGGGFADLLSLVPKEFGLIDKTYGEAFREGIGSGRQNFSTPEQYAKWKALNDETDPSRRQVNIAGGGFDEAGSAYDRLNAAISIVESERESKLSDEYASGVLIELERAAAALKDAAGDLKAATERRDSPPLRRPGD